MSAIDIIILIVFVVALVLGVMKGAVRQIGSFAGLVGGYIGARLFGDTLGAWLISSNPDAESLSPQMADVLGAIIVFVVIFIGFFIVARMLRGMISFVGLSSLDRFAGAVISILKWFLALSIVLNLIRLIAPACSIFTSSAIGDGAVMRCILEFFPWVMGIAGYN